MDIIDELLAENIIYYKKDNIYCTYKYNYTLYKNTDHIMFIYNKYKLEESHSLKKHILHSINTCDKICNIIDESLISYVFEGDISMDCGRVRVSCYDYVHVCVFTPEDSIQFAYIDDFIEYFQKEYPTLCKNNDIKIALK